MTIREYNRHDCEAMAALFYQTVHNVNQRDYTKEQLDAWADGKPDLAVWHQSFLAHKTLIAEETGTLLGFADLDGAYLDRLYVHKDHQRQGIATELLQALEETAVADGQTLLQTHASITALPFFKAKGFQKRKEQTVTRKGILLTNYVLEKRLPTF